MKMILSSPLKFLLTSFVLMMSCDLVTSHGRLILPPSRSSAWRYGFNVPANFNDNELNCGGYANQWANQGGKCGVCGDPYQGPHPNEAPKGKYAKGVIVGEYHSGDNILVKVDITVNHKGWHEFRLCVNEDPKAKVTQSCFDKHLLPLADGTGTTRYFMPDNKNRVYDIELKLPENVECSACVLQWKWNCGNSWGTDPDGSSGIGKGGQEQFYGCADIRITRQEAQKTSDSPKPSTPETNHGKSTVTSSKPVRTTPRVPSTPEAHTVTPTKPTTTTHEPNPSSKNPNFALSCTPTAIWKVLPGMIEWCNNNCNGAAPSCPKSHCTCTPSKQSD